MTLDAGAQDQRWCNSPILGIGTALANRIEITRGVITMEPNNAAIIEIKAKDANGGSPGFNSTRLQVPKLRFQKLAEGGQLKSTAHTRAKGEHSARAYLDPILVTAMRRKSQHDEALSACVGVGLSTIIRINGQGPRA